MTRKVLIFTAAFIMLLALSVSTAYAEPQIPGDSITEREVRSTKSGVVETYREVFKFDSGRPAGALYYYPGDVDTEDEFGYSQFEVYEYSGSDLTVTKYNKYSFIKGKKEYKFDSSGRVTYFAEYDKSGKKIYSEKRYFSGNNSAECKVYSRNDDVTYAKETWSDGHLEKAVFYERESDTALLFTKSGKFTITYKYDANGNIVSESRSGSGGYSITYRNSYPDGKTGTSTGTGDDSYGAAKPEKVGTVVKNNGKITGVKGNDGTFSSVEKINGDALTDKEGRILGIVDKEGNVLAVDTVRDDEILGTDGSVIATIMPDGTVKYNEEAGKTGDDGKTGEEGKEDTGENVAGFKDVFEGDYYAAAVKWAAENGITTGVTKESFAPSGTCTRAQVVTFLWRFAGSPEPASKENPFADVSEADYYGKAVLWAVEKGITNGTSKDTFSPEMTCSNAHIISFIWRYLGEPEATEESVIAKANPDKWYTDAAAWADTEKMIYKAGDASYNLNEGCPRADVVYDLYMVHLANAATK